MQEETINNSIAILNTNNLGYFELWNANVPKLVRFKKLYKVDMYRTLDLLEKQEIEINKIIYIDFKYKDFNCILDYNNNLWVRRNK